MGAHFKYPSRPSTVPKEDWNSLHKPEEEEASNTDTDSSKTSIDSKNGFTRLVDFIKAQLLEKEKPNASQYQIRQKAISAYKKNKAA